MSDYDDIDRLVSDTEDESEDDLFIPETPSPGPQSSPEYPDLRSPSHSPEPHDHTPFPPSQHSPTPGATPRASSSTPSAPPPSPQPPTSSPSPASESLPPGYIKCTLTPLPREKIDQMWPGGEWVREPWDPEPYPTSDLRAILNDPRGIHPVTERRIGVFPPAKKFSSRPNVPEELAPFIEVGPCIVFYVDTTVAHQSVLRDIHPRLTTPVVSNQEELRDLGYIHCPSRYRVYLYSYTENVVVLHGAHLSRDDLIGLGKEDGNNIPVKSILDRLETVALGTEKEQIELGKPAFEACAKGEGARGTSRCVLFGMIKEKGRELVEPPANAKEAEFAEREAEIIELSTTLSSLGCKWVYARQKDKFANWAEATNAVTCGVKENVWHSSGQLNNADAIPHDAPPEAAIASMKGHLGPQGQPHVDPQDQETHLTTNINISNINTSDPDPERRGRCGEFIYLANGYYTVNEPGGMSFLNGLLPHVSTAARLPAGLDLKSAGIHFRRCAIILYPTKSVLRGKTVFKVGHMRPRPRGTTVDVFHGLPPRPDPATDRKPKHRSKATTVLEHGLGILTPERLVDFVAEQVGNFVEELYLCNHLQHIPFPDRKGGTLNFRPIDRALLATLVSADVVGRRGEPDRQITPKTHEVVRGHPKYQEAMEWFDGQTYRCTLFIAGIRTDLHDKHIPKLLGIILNEMTAKVNKRRAEEELDHDPKRPRIEEPPRGHFSVFAASQAIGSDNLRNSNQGIEDVHSDEDAPEVKKNPKLPIDLTFLDLPKLEAARQHLAIPTALPQRPQSETPSKGKRAGNSSVVAVLPSSASAIQATEIQRYEVDMEQAILPLAAFKTDNSAALDRLKDALVIVEDAPDLLRRLNIQVDILQSRVLMISAAIFDVLWVRLVGDAMRAYAGKPGVPKWISLMVEDMVKHYSQALPHSQGDQADSPTQAERPPPSDTQLQLSRYFPGSDRVFTLLWRQLRERPDKGSSKKKKSKAKSKKNPGPEASPKSDAKSEPMGVQIAQDVFYLLCHQLGVKGAPDSSKQSKHVSLGFFTTTSQCAFAWLMYNTFGSAVLCLSTVQDVWTHIASALFGDRRLRVQMLLHMNAFQAALASHPASKRNTEQNLKLREVLGLIEYYQGHVFSLRPPPILASSSFARRSPPMFAADHATYRRVGSNDKPIPIILQPKAQTPLQVLERTKFVAEYIIDLTLDLHRAQTDETMVLNKYWLRCLHPNILNAPRKTMGWPDPEDCTNDDAMPLRELGISLRLIAHPHGPFSPENIRTVPGFFSALLFRIHTFGCTKFLRGEHLDTIPEGGWTNMFYDVDDFNKHLALAKEKNIGTLDDTIYSVPCPQRGQDLDTLWKKAEAWVAYLDTEPDLSWEATLKWLRKSPHPRGMGKLISMLFLEDLAFLSDVIPKPTAMDMGDVLVKNRYGAAKALVKLGLPCSAEAFAKLYEACLELRRSMSHVLGDLDADNVLFPFHPGDLEHFLCKLSKWGLISTEVYQAYLTSFDQTSYTHFFKNREEATRREEAARHQEVARREARTAALAAGQEQPADDDEDEWEN